MALAPASSHGGSSSVLMATVTLTDAQIKALPTTPAVIVPAVAGAVLRLVLGVVQKDFTGGAYANYGTGGAYFAYDTLNEFDVASSQMDATHTGAMLTGANARQASFPPYVPSGVVVTSGADLTDTNIGFTIDNSLGAFTGGNAANTLVATVFYVVVAP